MSSPRSNVSAIFTSHKAWFPQSDFLKFVFTPSNFRWISLGVLTLFYSFFFTFLSGVYLYGDMASAFTEAYGINKPGFGQTPLLNLMVQTLSWTGDSIFWMTLLSNILMVLALWYSVITLQKFGVSRFWLGFYLFFICLWPQFYFATEFLDKDPFISSATVLYVIELVKIMKSYRGENSTVPPIKQWVIFGLSWVNLYLWKDPNAIFGLLGFLAILFACKKWWKYVLITFVASYVLAWILWHPVLESITGNHVNEFREQLMAGEIEGADPTALVDNVTSTNTRVAPAYNIIDSIPWPFLPWQSVGKIMSSTNRVIPEQDAGWWQEIIGQYYDEPEYWQQYYYPLLLDRIAGIPKENFTQSEFLPRFYNLCFANLGDCFAGWFDQAAGIFFPKNVQGAISGVVAWPFMGSLEYHPENNHTEYIYLGSDGMTNMKFCTATTEEEPDGDITYPATKEDFKECFIKKLGTDVGTNLYDNLERVIKDDVYENQINPELTKNYLHFWVDWFNIFCDGFWFFWLDLIVLIAGIAKKRYRMLLPAASAIMGIYLLYILYSFTSYERYTWPMTISTPFLFVMFLRIWLSPKKKNH